MPEASAEQAAALAALSHHLAFQNTDFAEALGAADAALTIAEPLQDWGTVVRAFNTIAGVRERSGRLEESMALRERALKLALDHDLTQEARCAPTTISPTVRCSATASRRRWGSPSRGSRSPRRAGTACGSSS